MALRQLLRARVVPTSRVATALAVSASHGGRRGSKNLDWYYNAIARAAAEKEHVDPLPYPAEPLHGRKRARAFLDLQVGKDQGDAAAPVSRVVLELADDIVPVTVQNFLALCDRPAGQGYKGSGVFHIRKGFGLMAGDWMTGDGRSSYSSFYKPAAPEEGGPASGSRFFADENFIVRHSVPGVLTMANSGVHTNGSVFCITLTKASHLDGRNVAFGRVLMGMDAVQKLGAAFTVNFKPGTPITIKDAGVLPAEQWAAVDKALAAEAAKAAKDKTVSPEAAKAAKVVTAALQAHPHLAETLGSKPKAA